MPVKMRAFRHRFFPIVVTILALLGLSGGHSASAGNLEDNARAFVETLAGDAVRALTSGDVVRAERIRRFRVLFNERFAVLGIGRFVLGRHWRKASDAERKEYLGLFEDLMVVTYVDRFARYSGEPLEVIKVLALNETTVTVSARIVTPADKPSARVDWRIASRDGETKVVDVLVEGTSMSNTLRSEFSSLIRREGGSVAGLIEVLRKKTASLDETATN